MPSENETRACSWDGCKGTQTFQRRAEIAGSKAAGGGGVFAIEAQPAWLCDKNREHYDLVPVTKSQCE